MSTEYRLSYTASEINRKLGEIDNLASKNEIPYNTSDLVNDSGFTTETYVRNYAQPKNNYALKSEIPEVPVKSVNQQTGNVNLTAEDVGALSNDTVVPSALADLTDDNAHRLVTDNEKSIWNAKSNFSGSYNDLTNKPTIPSIDGLATEEYVTSQISAIPTPDVSGQISTHNTATDAHNDIRLLIDGLTTRLNTLANSTDEDLDQMSEIVAYIKSNKSLIEQVTTNKVNVADIINNLTTNVSNKPLSAAQGVALKALIDAIKVPTKVSELTNDSGYLTSIPAEYVTETELNAKGYLTQHQSLDGYAKTSDLGSLAAKNTVAKTDLASDVQTSLGKADTALQSYTETDPTVPSWAKASTKPSYTKSEIGLGNVDNVKQYSANNPPPYPVTSVNGKTGAVTLDAAAVGARPSTWTPTAANVGADPSGTANSIVSTHNSNTSSHLDIREQIGKLSSEKEDIYNQISQLSNKLNKHKEIAFVESQDDFVDTSKHYVLPDGSIYIHTGIDDLEFTNLVDSSADGWINNAWINSNGDIQTGYDDNCFVTNYIPVVRGQKVHVRGADIHKTSSNTLLFQCLDSNKNHLFNRYSATIIENETLGIADYDDKVLIYDVGRYRADSWMTNSENIAYIRVTGCLADGFSMEDLIVAVDEDITGVVKIGWSNTGLSFVTGNNGDNSSTEGETDNSTDNVKATIPSYWKTAVDAMSNTIQGLQDNAGVEAFQFVWFSDPHGVSDQTTSDTITSRVTDIGSVAQYTAEKFDIPFVAISGDIMSQASHSSANSVFAEYDAMRDLLSPIDRDKLIYCKGNHDGSWCTENGVSYLKNIGNKAIYNTIYRRQALENSRIFGGDGSYFYIDNNASKIRFIMLNGHTDGDSSTNSNGYAIYNSQKNGVYGTEQFAWLANIALDMPDGWGAIIMAHQPIVDSKDGAVLNNILKAYNNRTTYSDTMNVSGDYWGNGVTDATYTNVYASVDFKNAKGEVIAMFAGHKHQDLVYTADGYGYACPVIVITTAGADVRGNNTSYNRIVGTATETAMDIVTVDRLNKKIYCNRLGAGVDRVIGYGGTTVVTYKITNTLSNCTNSNGVSTIEAGNSYSGKITANSGYEMSSIKVTMGGTNITSTVVSDGTITIASVTGDVVITAIAVAKEAEVYTVTNNLTYCSNSNSATSATAGTSYSATITAASGYTLDGATVSVKMGNADITSSAYSNGKITIASVTGAIVIAVTAVQEKTTATYTNLFDVNGDGFTVETEGSKYLTNWMPYNHADNNNTGTIYHFKGFKNDKGYTNPYKMQFKAKNGTISGDRPYCTNANQKACIAADYDSSVKLVQHYVTGDTYNYVRFEFREALPANLIITANEQIVD